jgi:outer membrane protein TolC
MIARVNTDIALLDFEAEVRSLVSDVEIAYWELWFQYRALDAVIAGRDSALQTWRKMNTLYRVNAKGGEAEKEAQSREQYYLFRNRAEQALSRLHEAERNLRNLMGPAATDDRLICPADDPTTAKTCFDSSQVISEANRRSPEIRPARWRVKQRELELTAVKNYAASRDDRQKDGLRNAEQALARERAKLQEMEFEISHQVAFAIRDLEANFVLAQTDFNRRVAAQRQLDAVTAAYETGTVTLDVLLRAQQELAVAKSAYYRVLVNYVKSIATVHYRKGSLPEYHGVYLAEDSKHKE